jgi:S-formylglutathione hydrolase FrmB
MQACWRRSSKLLVLAACAVLGALALPPAHAQGTAATPSTGTVVADTLWSQALGTRKQVILWLPPSYNSQPGRRYPVAYFLHGLFGNEWDWIRAGKLDHTLDSLTAAGMAEMIVVMPDGDDSWYTTWNWLGDWPGCRRNPPRKDEPAASYCVPWPHYDDYVARDLVHFIDSTYRTRNDRASRGIAGLSMGGYGAIMLALAYPDVFSAAASHSGILSPLYLSPHPFAGAPRYAESESELKRIWAAPFWSSLGKAFGRDTAAWWSREPTRRAARLLRRSREQMPALKADVGVEDPFADESRAFRYEMQRLGVPLEYSEFPGAHTWAYWHAHSAESAGWLARQLTKTP